MLSSTTRSLLFNRVPQLLGRRAGAMAGAGAGPRSWLPPMATFQTSTAPLEKLLLADGVDEAAVSILGDAGFEVESRPKISKEELLDIIPEYDGIVVRSASKVTAEVLEAGKKLKVVGRAGTGVDNIDVAAATRQGVLVINTPGGNTTSAAELTFSLLTNLVRKVPAAMEELKDGTWARSKYSKGVELRGKTLGVVGCGRIGQRVAQYAQGVGMKCIGYDPKVSAEEMHELGIEKGDLADVLKAGDFLTLHVPKMEDTKHLINKDTLSTCKDGVYIVNAARGGVVHEGDLLDALNSGKVAGAALDVFEAEPKAPGFELTEELQELVKHPNVVATPHLGASTSEAQVQVAEAIAQQIVDGLLSDSWTGVVNAPHIAAAKDPKYELWVSIAKRLGQLAAELTRGDIFEVRVEAGGSVLNNSVGQELMRAAALQGIASVMESGKPVNIINAEQLCLTHGIESRNVMPALLQPAPTPTFTRLTVVTTQGERTFAGAVLGNQIRVTQIDNWTHFPSFKPHGDVIFFSARDSPGILSAVTGAVADANINLGILGVAREDRDVDVSAPPAMTYLTVDGKPPSSLLSALEDIPGVHGVTNIKFTD